MMMLRDRLADLGQVMMDNKPHPAKSQDPEGVWTKWEPAAGREAVTQDQRKVHTLLSHTAGRREFNPQAERKI